jgi:hypothetical protein
MRNILTPGVSDDFTNLRTTSKNTATRQIQVKSFTGLRKQVREARSALKSGIGIELLSTYLL